MSALSSVCKRLDLGRQVAFEPFGVARADAAEAPLDLAKRQQAEAHLEQGDAPQPEARERQRRRQAVAEIAQPAASSQSSGPATMIE